MLDWDATLPDMEQRSSLDAANNGESDLTFEIWEGVAVLKQIILIQ